MFIHMTLEGSNGEDAWCGRSTRQCGAVSPVVLDCTKDAFGWQTESYDPDGARELLGPC